MASDVEGSPKCSVEDLLNAAPSPKDCAEVNSSRKSKNILDFFSSTPRTATSESSSGLQNVEVTGHAETMFRQLDISCEEKRESGVENSQGATVGKKFQNVETRVADSTYDSDGEKMSTEALLAESKPNMPSSAKSCKLDLETPTVGKKPLALATDKKAKRKITKGQSLSLATNESAKGKMVKDQSGALATNKKAIRKIAKDQSGAEKEQKGWPEDDETKKAPEEIDFEKFLKIAKDQSGAEKEQKGGPKDDAAKVTQEMDYEEFMELMMDQSGVEKDGPEFTEAKDPQEMDLEEFLQKAQDQSEAEKEQKGGPEDVKAQKVPQEMNYEEFLEFMMEPPVDSVVEKEQNSSPEEETNKVLHEMDYEEFLELMRDQSEVQREQNGGPEDEAKAVPQELDYEEFLKTFTQFQCPNGDDTKFSNTEEEQPTDLSLATDNLIQNKADEMAFEVDLLVEKKLTEDSPSSDPTLNSGHEPQPSLSGSRKDLVKKPLALATNEKAKRKIAPDQSGAEKDGQEDDEAKGVPKEFDFEEFMNTFYQCKGPNGEDTHFSETENEQPIDLHCTTDNLIQNSAEEKAVEAKLLVGKKLTEDSPSSDPTLNPCHKLQPSLARSRKDGTLNAFAVLMQAPTPKKSAEEVDHCVKTKHTKNETENAITTDDDSDGSDEPVEYSLKKTVSASSSTPTLYSFFSKRTEDAKSKTVLGGVPVFVEVEVHRDPAERKSVACQESSSNIKKRKAQRLMTADNDDEIIFLGSEMIEVEGCKKKHRKLRERVDRSDSACIDLSPQAFGAVVTAIQSGQSMNAVDVKKKRFLEDSTPPPDTSTRKAQATLQFAKSGGLAMTTSVIVKPAKKSQKKTQKEVDVSAETAHTSKMKKTGTRSSNKQQTLSDTDSDDVESSCIQMEKRSSAKDGENTMKPQQKKTGLG